MKKLTKALAVTAMLFFAVCLTACGNPADAAEPTLNLPPEDAAVLATYGDFKILAIEFLYFLRPNIHQQEDMFFNWIGMSEEEVAAFWTTVNEETGLSPKDDLINNTLDAILERGILLVLAHEMGISYNVEFFNESLEDFERQVLELRVQGLNPEEMFYDFYGITLEEFDHVHRNMFIIDALVEYVAEGLEVTDEEFEIYLEANRSIFEQDVEARVVHVLIGTEPEMSPEEFDEAYDLAREILARINQGEDPRVLAAAYSDDPGSPDGFYSFPRGIMVPEFENWAFAASPGDTGIVETQFGFHVMYSEGRDEADEDHIRELARERMIREEAVDIILAMVEERNAVWDVDYALLEQLW